MDVKAIGHCIPFVANVENWRHGSQAHKLLNVN